MKGVKSCLTAYWIFSLVNLPIETCAPPLKDGAQVSGLLAVRESGKPIGTDGQCTILRITVQRYSVGSGVVVGLGAGAVPGCCAYHSSAVIVPSGPTHSSDTASIGARVAIG
jgi:hypothetical protein